MREIKKWVVQKVTTEIKLSIIVLGETKGLGFIAVAEPFAPKLRGENEPTERRITGSGRRQM